MYKRFLLGALVVVLASATTVATAALLEVKDYAKIIGGGEQIKGIGTALDDVPEGGPQTILLLGSDRRYADIATKAPVRSDTIILVRLDPSKGATAVMSLPRDLKVRIPNHGTDKINAAYAIGGPRLTVKTVRGLLGIPINHVINVNFGGFRKAVDRLKCVYVDVDRRYFNDNNPPYGGGANYATIDVKAGYQKLCGQDALDFVRYRHFDSDLVRAARQQEFLRQAKEQIGVSKVLTDRKGLLKVFADYTQTDIRGSKSILQLIKLAVESARHPVQEVHFPGRITGDYVTVSPRDIGRIREQFMNAQASPGPRGKATEASHSKSSSKKRRTTSRPSTPSMVATPSSVQDQAIRMAADLPFAVYYPKSILSGSEYLLDHGRAYRISDRGGHRYRAYRLVMKTREIGQYYGIQGTNWPGPPILDNPSETRKISGRSYDLFFDGDRLRLVAWRAGRARYWVSNTLLQTLSNQQMLAIARATSKVQ
jgi:LCP family protein required for cell wall assembly